MGHMLNQKLNIHRAKQAAQGWPILRGCPNTSAVTCVAYLDGLSPDGVAALLSDWTAYEASTPPVAARIEVTRRHLNTFPVLAAYKSHLERNAWVRSVATVPIKVIAGVRKDPAFATLGDWAQQLGLSPDDLLPRPPLAQSLDDLVPIPPRDLRRKIAEMAHGLFGAQPERLNAELTRHAGRCGEWQIALDIYFARSGARVMHQFDYSIWLKSPAGERVQVGGYERMWLLPNAWNYLTVENADRSVDLLGHIVETMIDLMP
ncbi:MAG: hypothetical protein WBO29_17080 [Albidovulum sp.]